MGMIDLPADDYTEVEVVTISIEDLLLSFEAKHCHDYLWFRVMNNYDGGLDMHLFKRGAADGGFYKLQMPETMPEHLPAIDEAAGEVYPRPTDWWVAIKKDYQWHVAADYVRVFGPSLCDDYSVDDQLVASMGDPVGDYASGVVLEPMASEGGDFIVLPDN